MSAKRHIPRDDGAGEPAGDPSAKDAAFDRWLKGKIEQFFPPVDEEIPDDMKARIEEFVSKHDKPDPHGGGTG